MADDEGVRDHAFRVNLAKAMPKGDHVAAVTPGWAIQNRIAKRVPRSLTEEEAFRLAMASALRNPRLAVGALFGDRFLREMGPSPLNGLAITHEEYGALLAMLPSHTSTVPFDALEGRGGVQREMVEKLTEACQTTMLSDAIRVAWRRSVVRTAAIVALRAEDSVPMLAAVLGESSRSDARRVDVLLSDLQDAEEEGDEYLQPVCNAITALAAALCVRS